jgi:hypothetical protein
MGFGTAQVTSDGGAGNGLEKVALTDLGTVRGGVRWRGTTRRRGKPTPEPGLAPA